MLSTVLGTKSAAIQSDTTSCDGQACSVVVACLGILSGTMYDFSSGQQCRHHLSRFLSVLNNNILIVLVQELALSFKHEIVDCSRLAPRLLNLTTLTSLSLSCQKIHQYDAPMLATSLASCISLKQLSFYVKQDDDDFAYRFKSFDGDFDDFDFKFGNESAETVLKVLPALSKLTHLHLSRELGCRVLPDILPKLPELRHLVVDDLNAWGSTTHDAAVGAAVGTLRHLQHLSAADNFLSDKEIEPLLATLPTSLTCLNLEKNRLPGDFPRLSKLQKLRVLNLNYCGVTRAVAQRVTALTALETLLTNDAEMPPEATEALVAALPPCIEHVEIMGSHFPESAAPLLARLTALKVLLFDLCLFCSLRLLACSCETAPPPPRFPLSSFLWVWCPDLVPTSGMLHLSLVPPPCEPSMRLSPESGPPPLWR